MPQLTMTRYDDTNTKTITATATGLAPLVPVSLMPERYSEHMQTLAKLKQIRELQVTRQSGAASVDGKSCYTLDVYTTPQSMSRLPTSLKSAKMLPAVTKAQQPVDRHPDAHLEKQFADFVRLRDDMYECCQKSHTLLQCEFCNEVTKCLLLGAALPGTLLSCVLPKKERARSAQRLAESLLKLAVSCPVDETRACPCQKELPRQMYQFLLETSDAQS